MVAPLDMREIEQAFQVRHMLEARTAALAAQKASDEDVIRDHPPRSTARKARSKREISAPCWPWTALFTAPSPPRRRTRCSPRYVIALQNVATRFWVYAMEKQSPAEQLEDVQAAPPPRRRHRGARSLSPPRPPPPGWWAIRRALIRAELFSYDCGHGFDRLLSGAR